MIKRALVDIPGIEHQMQALQKMWETTVVPFLTKEGSRWPPPLSVWKQIHSYNLALLQFQKQLKTSTYGLLRWLLVSRSSFVVTFSSLPPNVIPYVFQNLHPWMHRSVPFTWIRLVEHVRWISFADDDLSTDIARGLTELYLESINHVEGEITKGRSFGHQLMDWVDDVLKEDDWGEILTADIIDEYKIYQFHQMMMNRRLHEVYRLHVLVMTDPVYYVTLLRYLFFIRIRKRRDDDEEEWWENEIPLPSEPSDRKMIEALSPRLLPSTRGLTVVDLIDWIIFSHPILLRCCHLPSSLVTNQSGAFMDQWYDDLFFMPNHKHWTTLTSIFDYHLVSINGPSLLDMVSSSVKINKTKRRLGSVPSRLSPDARRTTELIHFRKRKPRRPLTPKEKEERRSKQERALEPVSYPLTAPSPVLTTASKIKAAKQAKSLYDSPFNESLQLKTKTTKRPITEMSHILSSIAPSTQVSEYYLPVVRYPGIYYSPEDEQKQASKKFCGTFYFVEPQSRILLGLGAKVAIYGSKWAAAIELREDMIANNTWTNEDEIIFGMFCCFCLFCWPFTHLFLFSTRKGHQ
jgi:hypothetical protein